MRIVAACTGKYGADVGLVRGAFTLPYGMMLTLQVGFSNETWPVMGRIPGEMVRSAVIPNVVWNAVVAQRNRASATPIGRSAVNVPSVATAAPSGSYVTIEAPFTRFWPVAFILTSTAWMVVFPL